MQCCSTCKNEKTSCTNGNKEQNSPSVFFHWNTEGLREAAHWAALHAHSARRRLRTSSERLGVSAESHGPYDRKEKKKKKKVDLNCIDSVLARVQRAVSSVQQSESNRPQLFPHTGSNPLHNVLGFSPTTVQSSSLWRRCFSFSPRH